MKGTPGPAELVELVLRIDAPDGEVEVLWLTLGWNQFASVVVVPFRGTSSSIMNMMNVDAPEENKLVGLRAIVGCSRTSGAKKEKKVS